MENAGSCRLQVIEGNFTRDTATSGKMDPYVMITLRQQTFKTETHSSGGKTPEWN